MTRANATDKQANEFRGLGMRAHVWRVDEEGRRQVLLDEDREEVAPPRSLASGVARTWAAPPHECTAPASVESGVGAARRASEGFVCMSAHVFRHRRDQMPIAPTSKEEFDRLSQSNKTQTSLTHTTTVAVRESDRLSHLILSPPYP